MTFEELKTEADKLGYNLLPKKKYIRCEPCICIFKRKKGLRVVSSVVVAHILGSIIIKTVGLWVFYSSPLIITGLWRLLTYTFIGAAECVIIYFLMKNSAFTKQIEQMIPKKAVRKHDV